MNPTPRNEREANADVRIVLYRTMPAGSRLP